MRSRRTPRLQHHRTAGRQPAARPTGHRPADRHHAGRKAGRRRRPAFALCPRSKPRARGATDVPPCKQFYCIDRATTPQEHPMHFASLDELKAAVGTTLGQSDWLVVDQDRINKFADATGDHQWIHVDPVKAAAGPFGSTVAHGFLTLSLLPTLIDGKLSVDGVRMAVNYGLNKVRFPAPCRSAPRCAPPPNWSRSRTSGWCPDDLQGHRRARGRRSPGVRRRDRRPDLPVEGPRR